jgi:hypothetical protein
LNIDEPNPADPDAQDAGDETQPDHDLDSRVEADEPTFAPGDYGLADAWWAQ